jgi:Peptidase S24-like
MSVSRWERGQRLQAHVCIGLGNLATGSDCWLFYGQAGLNLENVRSLLQEEGRAIPRRLPVLEFIGAGPETRKRIEGAIVAIPIFPVTIRAGEGKGPAHSVLDLASPVEMLGAPKTWCPNPVETIGLHVKGRGMQPLIHDGYTVFVDRKQIADGSLHGHIVVANHDEFGLTISRYWHMGNSRVFISDSRTEGVSHSKSGWRIIGKVLWWVGREKERAARN